MEGGRRTSSRYTSACIQTLRSGLMPCPFEAPPTGCGNRSAWLRIVHGWCTSSSYPSPKSVGRRQTVSRAAQLVVPFRVHGIRRSSRAIHVTQVSGRHSARKFRTVPSLCWVHAPRIRPPSVISCHPSTTSHLQCAPYFPAIFASNPHPACLTCCSWVPRRIVILVSWMSYAAQHNPDSR